MGAWAFVAPRLRDLAGDRAVRYVGRPESASPAEGWSDAHAAEQRRIVVRGLEGVASHAQWLRYACPARRVGRRGDHRLVAEARGRRRRGRRAAGRARDRQGQRRRRRPSGRRARARFSTPKATRSGRATCWPRSAPAGAQAAAPAAEAAPTAEAAPDALPLRPSTARTPRPWRAAWPTSTASISARSRAAARRARHAGGRRAPPGRRGHRRRGGAASCARTAHRCPRAPAAAQPTRAARQAADVAPPPDHRDAAARGAAHGRHADDLQRGRHDGGDGDRARPPRSVPGAPRRRPRLHVVLHRGRRRRAEGVPERQRRDPGRRDRPQALLRHRHRRRRRRGLVVPIVRDADRKSFAEIEREIARRWPRRPATTR